MVLAITIMLLVFGIAIPFFRSQIHAMNTHAGRFDAQQNVRFGASTIERELRVAGAGVPEKQPMIVQASPYAITFNVDLATNTTGSVGSFGAVYYDPDLPTSATISMTNAHQVELPLSTVQYPDSNYYNQSGPLSYAETISFWVAPDTTAGSNGLYALYRRVNTLDPTIVARGIVIRQGDPPPFTYMILNDQGQSVPIAQNRLPIYHVAIHGDPTDAGTSALTDSIRLVQIHLVGRYLGTTRGDTTDRVVDASVRLMNAGLLRHATCGEAPVFQQPVTATYQATVPPQVVVSWLPSVDEQSGEKDVERYVIFRRRAAETAFGEPYTSVAAGEAAYAFSDLRITPGDEWVYGVAAQDCGGQFSPVSLTTAVPIPADTTQIPPE
jgi:hypothetical protein